MSFFIKASKPEDWQLQLAEPDKQWKTGYSAKTLAHCWMAAGGFPRSVKKVFHKSEYAIFKEIAFLAGFVEHKVPLPGGVRCSQNDIFVFAKTKKDLVSIAVEGKVSETFGELVRDWQKNESKGKQIRLKFLSDLLQINQDELHDIRYQLLHRTASALIEAKRFNASTALMMVHSFNPDNVWFRDYSSFASLFGITADLNTVHFAKRIDDINLYLAWITGEKEYLLK